MCGSHGRNLPYVDSLLEMWQVGAGMPHEGNSENTFSLSGSLSNSNTHTAPEFLSQCVRINKNKAAFQPTVKRLRSVYSARFAATDEGEEVNSESDSCVSEDDDEVVEVAATE